MLQGAAVYQYQLEELAGLEGEHVGRETQLVFLGAHVDRDDDGVLFAQVSGGEGRLRQG